MKTCLSSGNTASGSSHIHRNTRLMPALVGLLFVLQLTFPYRGWTILLVGLGTAWLCSCVWARTLARGLRLQREVRYGWAQVGDRLQERFTLINTGWLPALWVEVIDHSTLPDYRVATVRYVGERGITQWQTEGDCTRRGLFTLGPTSLQTGDPLGLYTVRLEYSDSVGLMVTPPVVPLPAIEVAPGGRADEGRRATSHTLEHTVGASGVRNYWPGDALRHIHWPISAHYDDLYVRLFDNTPASDWWILVDLESRVQVGEGWDSTLEHAVTLAASLASRGLQSGRAVGLMARGDKPVWLSPGVGEPQRLAIIQALALVAPGLLSLREVLHRVGARFAEARHASLVIITPAVEGDWIAELRRFLRRGAVPTVLLLDPLSYGGTGEVEKALGILADLGIARHAISRELLDRPEARPGRQGRWEWRVTSVGHAIPVRRPKETPWRRLS